MVQKAGEFAKRANHRDDDDNHSNDDDDHTDDGDDQRDDNFHYYPEQERE
ncbi:hypothetical protein N9L19_01300 [bacterium]|nr:hypothetical protein [bacterium]